MKTDDWKPVRLSPEAWDVITEHMVRKAKIEGKFETKQDIANEIILKHKIAK